MAAESGWAVREALVALEAALTLVQLQADAPRAPLALLLTAGAQPACGQRGCVHAGANSQHTHSTRVPKSMALSFARAAAAAFSEVDGTA